MNRPAIPDSVRRALPYALPVAVLAGGAIAFAGLSSLQPARSKPTVQERTPTRVRVAELTRRTVSLDIVGHGTVRARDTIQLAAEVAGRVAHVSSALQVGSFVAAGEVLVRLDDREHRIARRSAAADVARAEADLARLLASEAHLQRDVALGEQRVDLARAEWQRARRLEASGAGATNLVDQARRAFVQEQGALQNLRRALDLLPHDVARARAALAASEANLDRADYVLERLVLTAPLPAQVRARAVDVGQVVAPGTPLIALANHDVYEVPVQLSHADLVKLAHIPDDALPTDLATPSGFAGRSPAAVTWLAHPEVPFEGVLTRIESVDADTRTIPAVVEVERPWAPLERGGAPLLPGAYCEVRLQGQLRPDAWVVPETSLREGDRLFVLRDGALAIVPVRVVHLLPGEVVVAPLEPIESGDRLVVSPLSYPVAGMGLQVVE